MDLLDFLEKAGFAVTRRGDGLFDVKNLGKSLTPAQVMDVWLAIRAWPLRVDRIGAPIEPN